MSSRRAWSSVPLAAALALALVACVPGAPQDAATTPPPAASSPAPSRTPTTAPSAPPAAAPAPPAPTPPASADRGDVPGGTGGGTGPVPAPAPVTPAPAPAPTPAPAPSPAVPAACTTSDTDPGIPAAAFGSIAEYSTTPLAQGRSCDGFRAFLSTGLPQYDSQSYEFFGYLANDDGSLNSLAVMSQGNTLAWGIQLPLITMEQAGVIVNRLDRGQGPAFGGVNGLANVPVVPGAVDVGLSYEPWSIAVNSTSGTPQSIALTAVSGAIGAVGTVYELRASLPMGYAGTTNTEATTLTVRVKDLTGMIQWGYGPNGFFPLWMFDGTPVDGIPTRDQRTPIMSTYGGDIGAYLAATNDPMTGQGSHYYSSPAMQVESWSLTMGSSYAASGTGGSLFFDNLTETYNASAEYIVKNGYGWTEFSVMMPDRAQGGLIAKTGQADVGELRYAMFGGAGSTQNPNGTLAPTANWPQDAIHLDPIASSMWTSPQSCYEYVLTYHAVLDAGEGRPTADLTFSAATHPEQEITFLGRSVYEGLFTYTGTYDGQPVSGYAWGEIQGTPTGRTPPACA